jgi:hypothetical protein
MGPPLDREVAEALARVKREQGTERLYALSDLELIALEVEDIGVAAWAADEVRDARRGGA